MRLIWLILLLGCKSETQSSEEPFSFPDDFAWGTATAGFQVDMGCPTWDADACDDRASDWYQWVTTSEIVDNSRLYVSGEPVANGPGMWETFEEDVTQMAEDGMRAYRFSIEWSRLFPDAEAESAQTVAELSAHADEDAVARYHAFFTALKNANIEPLVTLNHYTMPIWVHDGVACHFEPENCQADGWVNEERITRLIELYAGFVGQEFGGEVDRWATLNEPFATTLSGYAFPGEDRSSPPGLSLDIDRVVKVMLNQIVGHGKMYHALKAYDVVDVDGDGASSEVGIVMNMTAIDPKDSGKETDITAAEHMDYLYHRLYLDAMTSGAWDGNLDGVVDETRPELAGTLDYIGINYYNQVRVVGFPFPLYDEIPIFDFFPEFSWEPYPEGLARVVDSAWSYGLPIYVTENGTPYVVDRGVEVLEDHLSGIEGNLADGVDVRGYFYWSYVDNYEWNHGFDLRFGLYELDPATKARHARPVRDAYAAIIERGRVSESDAD